MKKLLYNRMLNFIKSRIRYYKLDLTDKIVYTEFGTGSYIFTPLIAFLAGAKKIYAINKDSSYGRYDDNKKEFIYLLKILYIKTDKIILVKEKKKEHLSEVDILTNSGFVRPIDRFTINNLKSTTVIPLMWETWEFREQDIDLEYAREKEILILGTNESNLGLNIFNYRGFLVSKLMFDCNLAVHDDKILLIGSGRLGEGIADFFKRNNIDYKWINLDNNMELNTIASYLKEVDAIIFAEHCYNKLLIGENGLLNLENIKILNLLVQLIHICGNIDMDFINKLNLSIYPSNPKSFGYMSVTGDYLSPKTTIELVTAGFKVGEVMSNYRVNNSLKDSYLKAIKHNLIDDFKGGYLEK